MLIGSRPAQQAVLNFIDEAEDRDLLAQSYGLLPPVLQADRGQTAPELPLVQQAPRVECREVSFAYTKEQLLIEDFSCSLEAGSHTLVTGPSGSGKSSLVR